ncbi:type VI secretion system baseplate subunit TssG [Pseudomonas gingeri]|uniref:type VI secretion system baseplate subunit TssG n=1 Tax=Pseudomonas gingeri TaxID=117681 RepID=UPI0015A17C81|nr:type VI secretion system baseplate subunit TssG [Pseudomonas gingeri]NWD74252.1 type VI secretion system baseplate subunit TssG [Pseudomonas gingeri]
MHDLVDPPPDLVAQPWRYDFFAALRLLERTYPDAPRWGTAQRLGDDPLRLAQHVSLAFEPAMIAQLRLREGRAALLAVNFFGLTGANGPMPLHFSEDVLSRQINHGDSTLAHFLDVFHHRLLSLLYRSWARVRPVVWADRPADDRFADYVSAFSPGESRALPNATRFYAPQLIDQRRSAAGLLALVRDLLRLPVALSTLGRHRTVLAFDERLQLGRRRESARLGGAALLGRRLWNIQHSFCLHLGPLSWADYQHLLPGGRYFEALCELVECYVGPALQWDLDLRLESGQRPGLRLGAPQGLGRGCWLGHRCAATPGWRFEPARFQRATPTSAG